MIGMYGSSPKVKYREGMFGASYLIAKVQVPSQDRVSISPKSCVDLVLRTQAEIVCQFCRDRVSISPGDRLEFVGDRLRFEKSSPRWRIVGEERGDESLWNPTWIRTSFLKKSQIQLEFPNS